MATPASSPRRVLGDKTPNASIQSRLGDKNNKSPAITIHASTFEQLRKKLVAFHKDSPAQIGQKRSIAQVDGVDEYEGSSVKQGSALQRMKGEDEMEGKVKKEDEDDEDDDEDAEAGCEMEVVALKEEDDATEPSPTDSKATTSTLLTSFHASQEGPLPIEEQFEIQDETSQKTLEILNKTPLPQNGSQPYGHPDTNPGTEGSQDSMRMSSFVDFDAAAAPEEEDLKMTSPKPASPLSGPERKALMDEKAEALRTRLQLAAYKVNTGQTKTPFYWLHRRQTSQERARSRDLPLIKTEEDVVSDARSCATEGQKPVVRNLNSVPMPSIVPTAYSARYVVAAPEEIASSPPVSVSTGSGERAESLTPRQHGTQSMRTPVQLSSSPGSGRSSERVRHRRIREQRDVLSSALRDAAANRLLELMRAAAES